LVTTVLFVALCGARVGASSPPPKPKSKDVYVVRVQVKTDEPTGRITVAAKGFRCVATRLHKECDYDVRRNASVRLHATQPAGWWFKGWNGHGCPAPLTDGSTSVISPWNLQRHHRCRLLVSQHVVTLQLWFGKCTGSFRDGVDSNAPPPPPSP
jgi:hypothetical protein